MEFAVRRTMWAFALGLLTAGVGCQGTGNRKAESSWCSQGACDDSAPEPKRISLRRQPKYETKTSCTTCAPSTCSTCAPGKAAAPVGDTIVPSPSVTPAVPDAPRPLPKQLPEANAARAGSLILPAAALHPTSNLGAGVEVVSGVSAPVAPTGSTIPIGVVPPPADQPSTFTVRFGAADDYRTLVGQVAQFRRTWRLRYAALESDDRHGGSVILVGDQLDALRDGQVVRVVGSIVPSDDRSAGARFQVQRIEIIEAK